MPLTHHSNECLSPARSLRDALHWAHLLARYALSGLPQSSRADIQQVIPDISSFARRSRDARHDLNEINHDLLVIKTGLGVAQDDFSVVGPELPLSLVDGVSRIIDSCDDTSERLHKAFLKLSYSSSPKKDWQSFKDGALVNLRHDLDASKMVLELALDYIAL